MMLFWLIGFVADCVMVGILARQAWAILSDPGVWGAFRHDWRPWLLVPAYIVTSVLIVRNLNIPNTISPLLASPAPSWWLAFLAMSWPERGMLAGDAALWLIVFATLAALINLGPVLATWLFTRYARPMVHAWEDGWTRQETRWVARQHRHWAKRAAKARARGIA